MRTQSYCLGILLLISSHYALAQIVECVDANGKKTYAQSCQDEADKKREITVPKAPPKPDDSAWKAKEEDFEKRRQERLKAEQKDAQQQQRGDQAAQNCAEARRKLDLMDTGKQKSQVDPTTGEHLPLDGAQRQAELDSLRDTIQRDCH